MSRYEKQAALAQWQAAIITLPTSTTKDTYPSTGVNTGGLSLTAFEGYMVSLRSTQAVAIRAFATSTAIAAATADDYPLSADTDYAFTIVPEARYISVYCSSGTAGSVYVAKTTSVGVGVEHLGSPGNAS